uniref:Gag protein n=1 Tax=Romanomermis culicivorax TaxID=13658 RepID=A0A915KU67_ROMCU
GKESLFKTINNLIQEARENLHQARRTHSGRNHNIAELIPEDQELNQEGMTMQEIQDLLRNTVAPVTELYTTRSIVPTGLGDLPPFAGDPNDLNWSEWEKRFSRLAILSGATTLDRKTALLANYLCGAALNFFSELEAHQPALATSND